MSAKTPFKVVIPARYGSSRLSGKPLLEIAGKTILEHVFHRAEESAADTIIIATDDARIQSVAESFGARVCMTDPDHKSGTDRISQVVEEQHWKDDEIIVNLQGDEPLMPAALLDCVAADLEAHPDASLATICTRITDANDFHDPNIVKVVRDQEGYALYFSRAPVPWDRDCFSASSGKLPETADAFRHIGLYAYKAGFLRTYRQYPECSIESCEALEQLRALWQGNKIHVVDAPVVPGPGVDTQEDLERVATLLQTVKS